MDKEWLIDDFAIRSFRDRADEDYVSARMAFRAALLTPCLWSSLQAVEKYLKCILLLNRIVCKKAGHDLALAVAAIETSGKVRLDLTPRTRDLIARLDEFGSFRYLEVSNVAFGSDLINLDRAVWELRRYCTKETDLRAIRLERGVTPPKYRIEGGYLEGILDGQTNPAREPTLWQNAFFGKRQRRNVRKNGWMKAENAPLYLNPQILDEVLKYVYLPKPVVTGYREYAKSKCGL